MKRQKDGGEPAQAKVNGAGATSDEPMAIDSDDDEPSSGNTPLFNDRVEFEEQEPEFDSSRPYEPVIQTLNLPLETKVLHLSFLHLPTDLRPSSLGSLPPILLEKVVITLACSDCSVRVVTIPLTPPSERSKSRVELHRQILCIPAGQGFHHEQMLILSSSNGHRSYPRGTSMALVVHSTKPTDTADTPEDDDTVWDLLVASHSADMSGLLLIHKISLLADGSGLDIESSKSDEPWRKLTLASPARSISFNTSLYPAMRHCQLLVAEMKGSVRVYHCLSRPESDRGSWLISLYPSSQGSKFHTTQPRKDLLAAQWIFGGKAIAVLLADGEWGVWDIEASGPKSKTATDGWQASLGVSLHIFNTGGWIGDPSVAAREASKSSKTAEIRPQLAPMTPATRKVRQESLFAGSSSKAVGPARGGISVCSAGDRLTNRKDDETLLLWHGNSIMIIPSLLAYWQNKTKGSGNLFGSGARGQPKELNNLHLGGEIRNNVSLIPSFRTAGDNTKGDQQSSILVTGEHRFIIVTTPLSEPSPPLTKNKHSPEVRFTAADQAMLERGELDVDGIDGVLASMSSGHQTNGHRSNGIPSKSQNNRLSP